MYYYDGLDGLRVLTELALTLNCYRALSETGDLRM